MKAKQINIAVFFICVLLAIVNVKGQNSADSIYTKTMTEVLTKLDTAKTVDDLQICKSQFERIGSIDQSKPIVQYYIAYCDIKSVYFDSKSSKNQLFLDEAKRYIDKLKTDKNIDQSEVETLDGFYYMALIISDPVNNGQKYYQNVTRLYEKAMSLNVNNPRPICLLAFFEQQLPAFLKSGKDNREQINRARHLFDTQQKNINIPYWGRNYLDRIINEE